MTDNQLSLTDGIGARDEAVDRVERNADNEWKEAAYLACCLSAEMFPTLTSDDVWLRLALLFPQHSTHERRAMGAVMRRAARDGIIAPTGEYTQSVRPQCHARPVAVWSSLICEDDIS